MESKRGLLLVGHGTRQAPGLAELRQVFKLVEERLPDWQSACCFLELAEPDIPSSVRTLAAAGVRDLCVLPVLLFRAGHAKRDIPEAVEQAARDIPGLSVRFGNPLECHPKLLELSTQRFQQAIEQSLRPIPPERTLLLVVGRGSYDPAANAELARFARLRWEQTPVGWLETCYLAMTEPQLETALPRIARLGFQRVVVQPHLLFQGQLLDRVQEAMQTARQEYPDTDWLLTERLGVDPLLAEALAARALERPTATTVRP